MSPKCLRRTNRKTSIVPREYSRPLVEDPKAVTAEQDEVDAMLEQLIDDKQSHADRGLTNLVFALGMISPLVRVDATVDPPRIQPPAIFDMRLDNQLIGLRNCDIRYLKANLSLLLPEIDKDIERLPERASMLFSYLAEYLRLALITNSRG